MSKVNKLYDMSRDSDLKCFHRHDIPLNMLASLCEGCSILFHRIAKQMGKIRIFGTAFENLTMKRIVTLLVSAFISLTSLYAQRGLWYSGDLLTSNQIQCITEDSRGFLWIGTEYGLNRFDGYQFANFFHDETKEYSLVNNYVRCMANVSDGRILVGTGRGLQLFCPDVEEFHTVAIQGGATPFVNQISVLHNGEIWFLASGMGICRMTSLESMKAELLERLSLQASGRIFSCFMEDTHGIVWIGTDRGVYQCNVSTLMLTRFNNEYVNDMSITGICEDVDGNVTITTGTQVFRWNRSSDFVEELHGNRPYSDITHIFQDNDGEMYVALRGQGLRYYNKEEERMMRYDDNGRETRINRLDVSAFYMDSKRNIWLGCYMNGIMLIPNGQTQFHSRDFQDYRGLTGGGISSMIVDNRGNLWTSFNNNPVTCMDRDGKILTQLQEQPYVCCLFQAADGTVWAGLFNGGIARLDTRYGFIEPVPNSGDNHVVQCIVQDDTGCLYYSTRGAGFSRYNPETGEVRHWSASAGVNSSPKLDNDWINSMAVGNDGLLWIGHSTGINCFDTHSEEFRAVPKPLDIPDISCSAILCDESLRVWVGTEKGLIAYSQESDDIVLLDTDKGLSNNNIRAIVRDAAGNIWCSTSLGLDRIVPDSWDIDKFYSGAGLIDKNYTARACAWDSHRDILYFGSRRGITFFEPKVIDGDGNVGNVVLTSFYLNDVAVDEGTLSGRRNVVNGPVITSDHFRLSAKDNSFTLEFSTFDYGDRDCISYEYSFGQNQWNSTPAGVNRITFTHLGPGKHQLSVRACNNNSRSKTSVYAIIIDRPWYLSAWAMIMYCLLALGVIAILYFNNRQKRERELSDAKLQSFTNVAHELCSPLTMVISPLDELLRKNGLDDDSRHSLTMMHKSAHRIMSLLNQLLDIRRYDEGQMHLKCRETDFVSFVQGAYEVFMYSAGQRNIRYSYEHTMDEMLVWIDRDSIEKVMTNLLSNAFKYTPDGGEIKVLLSMGTDSSENGAMSHYAEVSVSDTGIGLDVDDVNKVFDRFYRAQNNLTSVTLGLGIGLNYSRILVEMHHGSISAENRSDTQGSRFSFRIPLGNSHLSEEEIVNDDTPFVFRKEESEVSEESLKPRSGAARGYRILVVDDDEAMLDYISYSLRSAYYKVVTCRNGKDGLQIAIAQKPDLIISDVVMPEMDGISFVRALRNNPNISHIPVILLSARNRLQDRMEGIETGADAYLPKPFYVNELKIQVRSLINNRLIVKGKFSGDQEQKDKVETPEFQSSDEHLMERIMEVVNKNMSNPDFSVEQLSEMVGVSRTQLHRKVKNMTGLSAGRFVQNIRMQQAAALLKQKGMNIAEIADMVGFSTRTHFATAFKSYYGMSPSEYIRQQDPGASSDETAQD